MRTYLLNVTYVFNKICMQILINPHANLNKLKLKNKFILEEKRFYSAEVTNLFQQLIPNQITQGALFIIAGILPVHATQQLPFLNIITFQF